MTKSQVIYKDYSKDAERTALVSGENLAHMFGKIARWYTDISWVGHTHTEASITDLGTYAGASTKGGAATSANKLNIGSADIGSETKPVYFSYLTGKPVACTYSLNASVPANAVFTDINVKQSPSTADESREVLFAGNTGNTETTGVVGKSNKLYFNPSTGALTATSFSGSLAASNLTGTIDAGRLPTTAVTAGSYGPAAGGTLAHGGTFDVAYVTVDKYGRLTAASTKTFTLPAQYVHPSYTEKTSGLYKITVDATGHVSATAAVAASDLPSHTHPYLPDTTKYAGSSSVGGAATSANKLNIGSSNIGNSTTPVYFDSTTGLPVALSYTIAKSVPADAKFTDTVYTHPSYTEKASGLYKITVDSLGHVSAATAVTGADLPSHSHTLSIAASSGTSSITLAASTKYQLTAGGSTYIFTTPPNSNTTYTISTGDSNGQIKVTPSSGDVYNVSVKGLGSAAYTASSAYAPATHSHNYAGSSSAGGPALSVSTKGDDVVLGTANSSTNDSGDIVFLYGNGSEKMRIWTNNDYSTKSGPLFRLYSSSGTLLYNGTLVLGDGTGASGTWSITAASANKLNTNAGSATNPVYFSNGVPVACSYSLYRSVAADLSVTSSNTANYPYHLLCFMKNTATGYKDFYAVFRVTAGYDGQISGVYEVTVRMNQNAAGGVSLRLISGFPFRNDFANVVVAYNTAATNTYAYVFLVCSTYARTTVRIIHNSGMTFYNSNEVADTTASDKKTSTNVYASLATAGTALIGGSFANTKNVSVGNVASSLSAENVGGQVKPVYFSSGVPSECKTVESGSWFTNVATIGSDGVMEIGKYIDMHLSNGSSNDYDYRITNTSTSAIEFSSRATNNALKLYAPSGHTRIQFQTAESNKAYTATGITAYPLTSSGMTMTIESGGNMIIGGGESPSTLINNDFDNCTSSERESLYLAADASIIFASNVQTFAERKCAVWENLGCFRPFSNNSLSIGRADYYWNKAYITQIYGSSFSGNSATSNYPYGFASRSSSASWAAGGTFATGWNAGDGCEIAFMKNYPVSGQLSCCIDGYFFQNEGKKRVLDEANFSSYITPASIGAAASSHTHSYIPLSGSSAITGALSTSESNGFRIYCGGYGAFFRNDGRYFYLLLTDKKTDGSEKTGNNWNSLRPFFVNLASGRVEMQNGLNVGSGMNVNTVTIANGYYNHLKIIRTDNKYYAGIKFYNRASGSTTDIYLGSIAMGGTSANGGLLRVNTDESTMYTVLDTGNSSVSRSLTSGTKIATITIAGTATDLYCQTNTNTTYTFATGDGNGQIKVTPSGGSAQNISVKGLGSAAYTDSSAYAAASHNHNLITRNSDITYGASRLQWFDLSGTGTVSASTPYNPGDDWFHHIMLNHDNGKGYYVDLAICFHSDLFYYKRISGGVIANKDRNNGWVRIIDSSCIGSQSVASAGKWTTARTLTLSGSVTGSASIDGSGNVSLATTTNHTHSYLPLAGGTMTGDITFTGVTSTSYPATSCKLYWTGSTDWAKIYYRVDSSDAGRLVLDLGDDTNTRIDFAYNGTTKSYIDTSGNFSGNAATATTATNATYINIVATNEIRFNASTKPSSAMDLYIGYTWSDGNGDAKINSYIFQNGNRTLTKIQAASIYLGNTSGTQGSITLCSSNRQVFSVVASPDANAGGGITLPPTGGLMTDIVYKASSGVYGALGKVENTGCIASLTASDISSHTARSSSTQSFGGTYTIGSTWYNMLSIRHRNGAADGGSFGFYIRNSLTSSSSLVYNQQYNGSSWRGEATIVDSKNLGSHLYTILWSGSTSCTARSSTSITLTTSISANKYRMIKVVWNCGSYTGVSEFRADTLNVTNNIPSGSDATTVNMIQFKIASDGKSVSVGPGTTTITVLQIAGVYPI